MSNPHPRNELDARPMIHRLKERGLSNGAIARLAAVDEKSVRRWLSGEKRPSVASLNRLIEALDEPHSCVGHVMATDRREDGTPLAVSQYSVTASTVRGDRQIETTICLDLSALHGQVCLRRVRTQSHHWALIATLPEGSRIGELITEGEVRLLYDARLGQVTIPDLVCAEIVRTRDGRMRIHCRTWRGERPVTVPVVRLPARVIDGIAEVPSL